MLKTVDWPEGEPVPRSVEEALAMGWEIDAGSSTFSEDGRTVTGYYQLTKEVGMVFLTLTAHFEAVYTFDKPRDPVVTVDGEVDVDRGPELGWSTLPTQ
jgi:hypothetical protein